MCFTRFHYVWWTPLPMKSWFVFFPAFIMYDDNHFLWKYWYMFPEMIICSSHMSLWRNKISFLNLSCSIPCKTVFVDFFMRGFQKGLRSFALRRLVVESDWNIDKQSLPSPTHPFWSDGWRNSDTPSPLIDKQMIPIPPPIDRMTVPILLMD